MKAAQQAGAAAARNEPWRHLNIRRRFFGSEWSTIITGRKTPLIRYSIRSVKRNWDVRLNVEDT